MERTVVQGHLDIDHQRAGQAAVLHGFDHTLFDSRDKLRGNYATFDFIKKFKSGPTLIGLEANVDFAELTASA